MEKTIIIRDYADNPTTVTIENFETVAKIHLMVKTGDEILRVIWKDYSEEEYDSSDCRRVDYNDGEYDVYWPDEGINLLDDPEWNTKTNSYDRMYG